MDNCLVAAGIPLDGGDRKKKNSRAKARSNVRVEPKLQLYGTDNLFCVAFAIVQSQCRAAFEFLFTGSGDTETRNKRKLVMSSVLSLHN